MRSLTVPPGTPAERLDKLLHRLLADTSRTTIQRWIEEKRVLVDGRTCRAKDWVGAGATIAVDPAPPPASRALPDPTVNIDCIYEDEHLLVVNKPAGLVVHPARGHATGTLVNGLLNRPGFSRLVIDPRDPEGYLRPGIVHRLDKDTSGLLVIAKDERAREGLKSQISRHEVAREYDAITLGVPKAGQIVSFYGRHPHQRLKFTSLLAAGKRAVTQVAMREQWPKLGAALIGCRLETGRTHQIRVHLAEQCKTPLLGDVLYGGSRPSQPLLGLIAQELGRQALHARRLAFRHPLSGADVCFEAPPPADFAAALERLRAGST